MKKLLLLIVPAMLLMAACNNTPNGATATVVRDTIYVHDTVWTAKPKDGAVPATAQVFEDLTLKPVAKASIAASENGKVTETVASDAEGNYAFKTLQKGHAYDFSCTKQGYITATGKAVYDGTNSLPGFAMKSK